MSSISKIRIFVSSVQKELAPERTAVAQMVAIDPFLLQHCEVVLYENQPPSGRPNKKAYLDELKPCQICRGDESATVNRAAFLLFASHPATRFPQCEILADAYEEPKISGRPKGQETIDSPLLFSVERALKFIDDHTFHPRRVVGINNIRLTEYPAKALREALVNAVAHRNYDDATRKIILRVFSDRIEIASPGYPLKPLTLAKLRRGNYRPCSRNPLITQTLALLGQMEQRGTGFARMHDAMLDHGLPAPSFTEQDGYFIVTLPGPNGDYDRIRLPADAPGIVPPAVEAALNERQKKIILQVQQAGLVTRGWCVNRFNVVNDTAGRDLRSLVELGILAPQGKGRTARYVWQSAESTDNRPTKLEK
ncbi:MAG: ATP-binding protein [Verrucomicrobiota bacterium]